MNLSVWLPSDSSSPSLTAITFSALISNCSSIAFALAVQTRVRCSYIFKRVLIFPEWSGSKCCTTRYSGSLPSSAFSRFSSHLSVTILSTVSIIAIFSSSITYELYAIPFGIEYCPSNKSRSCVLAPIYLMLSAIM